MCVCVCVCNFDTIVTTVVEGVVETKNEHKIASPHVVVSKCLQDVKCQLIYQLEHNQYDQGTVNAAQSHEFKVKTHVLVTL